RRDWAKASKVAPLLRASATFPGLLLRGSSDVVRARIAKAYIACQNIASSVAVFERVILAVPIHTISAYRDHRAPRGLVGVSRWTEEQTSKSSDSSKNHAGHRGLHTLVITPERPAVFADAISAEPEVDVGF